MQPSYDGLAQTYLVGKDFLDGSSSAMVLSNNIFFGHCLPEVLTSANAKERGGTVLGYRVLNSERYGVVGMDTDGTVMRIVEKPKYPLSHYAVCGLYSLYGTAPKRARSITPSKSCELEIASMLETYGSTEA